MMRLYDLLDIVAFWLTRLVLGLCAVAFFICMLLLLADISGRYLLNYPLQRVSETVTITFIWIFLLGAAALYSRNEDIFVDTLFGLAPERLQALWLLLIQLAIAGCMILVLQETLKLIHIQRRVLTPLLRLPLAVQHYALATATALIAFTSLIDALGSLILLLRGQRPERRKLELNP